MSVFSFQSDSEAQTERFGIVIGRCVPSGFAIALNGTLGSGKTRLTQAIGKGLGVPAGCVVSPTFTLATPHQGRLGLLHLDAYRIKSAEEVDELGLDEQIEEGALLVVEWAERIEAWLPPLDIVCQIEVVSDQTREFTLTGGSERGDELIEQLRKKLESPTNS